MFQINGEKQWCQWSVSMTTEQYPHLRMKSVVDSCFCFHAFSLIPANCPFKTNTVSTLLLSTEPHWWNWAQYSQNQVGLLYRPSSHCQNSYFRFFLISKVILEDCERPDRSINLPIKRVLCGFAAERCHNASQSSQSAPQTTKSSITSIVCCRTLSSRGGCASRGLSSCSVCDTPTEPPGAETLSSFIRAPESQPAGLCWQHAYH